MISASAVRSFMCDRGEREEREERGEREERSFSKKMKVETLLAVLREFFLIFF